MTVLYKKASITFLLSAIGLCLAFGFQVILGRVLSPLLYGEFTMYVTYSTILSIIPVMGMDRNLIKEVSRNEGNEKVQDSYLIFSMRVALVVLVFTSIIFFAFKEQMRASNYGVSILLLLTLIKSFIAIIDGYLQGIGKIEHVTLMNSILNNLLKIIFFVILIFQGMNSLNASIFSFVSSEIITILIRLKILFKSFRIQKYLKISLESKREYLKYSLTVALISGIGLMLQNIDKVMISKLMSLSDVGIYKVAQNYVGS